MAKINYIKSGGIIFIGIALVLNPLIVGWLVSPDGQLDFNNAVKVLVFDALFLILGILFIFYHQPLSRHLRSSWKNYLLLSFTVVVALIIFEIALRSFSPDSYKEPTSYQINNYEYSHVAYLNSLGFRDEEFTRQKDDNTFRIFLIGDSFVYSPGVKQEEMLDKLLEGKLNNESDTHYEVYNLDVVGGGPSLYFKTAKQFKDYQPDFIMVSLYVDNDIEMITERWRRLLSDIKIVQLVNNVINNVINNGISLHRAKRQEAVSEEAANIHLQAVNQFEKTSQDNKCVFGWIRKYDVDKFYQQLMCEGKLNAWLLPRAAAGDNQNYYDLLTARFNKDPATKLSLSAIKKLYKDIPFILLINPSKYQVSTRYFEELRKISFIFNEDKVVDRKLQDAIISWAQDYKIDYLDILFFMKGDAEEPFFYALDDHYTPAGNAIIAEKIYGKLIEMGVYK